MNNQQIKDLIKNLETQISECEGTKDKVDDITGMYVCDDCDIQYFTGAIDAFQHAIDLLNQNLNKGV